jgi:hypothetical protein
MPGTVPPLIPLEAKHDKCHTPKFPGLGLIHSPSTHLDPASTNRRPTKEQGLHATRPGAFSPSHPLRHHGVQGWPAIPGARRYSSFHSARQNFTSKAPLASLPSLDPIKGKAGDSMKGGTQGKTSHHPTVEDQHHKKSPLYSLSLSLSLSLRPGIGSLSHSL